LTRILWSGSESSPIPLALCTSDVYLCFIRTQIRQITTNQRHFRREPIRQASYCARSAAFCSPFFPLQLMYLLPPTRTKTTERNETRRNPGGRKRLGKGERGGREPRLHLMFLPTDHLSFFSTQDNESSNRASERGFGGATPIFHRGRHRRQRTPTNAYILVFSFPFHVFSPSFSSVLGFGVTLQRERQIKRGVLSFSFLVSVSTLSE
jgi:hypothetical protein